MDYINYIFFYSHNRDKYSDNKDRAVFSQWRYSKFTDEDGITYNSGEQYMMYHKAVLMKDFDTAKKILSINIYDPKEKNESKVNFSKIKKIKDLGRIVANFDEHLWNENKVNIVRRGNLLKFSQNDDLKQILLTTRDKIIMEASPFDKIWGIGLSESDAKKIDPKNYEKSGQNLLGKSIMWVRDQLG